jgi:hypothetical protein
LKGKLYNSRFHANLSTNTKLTKDRIIATYVAKINAPLPLSMLQNSREKNWPAARVGVEVVVTNVILWVGWQLRWSW